MNRFHVAEAPAPIETPTPEQAFKVRYRVENTSRASVDAHWDHLLIRDEHGFPVHEVWHHEDGVLQAGASYAAEPELPALRTGRYELWLTLDSEGAYEQESYELVIGTATAGAGAGQVRPGAGAAGDDRFAHTYHVKTITPPAPLEPIRAGEPFEIRYEAYNEGGQESPPTVDAFVLEGTAATWESRWHQSPLGAGQHYWPSIEVPALPEGEYVLRWKLDEDNAHADRIEIGEIEVRLAPDA